MTLQVGHTYLTGRLGRDWEHKTMNTVNGDKPVITTSLAYSPSKDADTIWVSLTVWPSNSGSQALQKAVEEATGKGAVVMVSGKCRTFKKNDGTTGWSMAVWDLAKMILPPKQGQRSGSAQPQQPAYNVDEEPF